MQISRRFDVSCFQVRENIEEYISKNMDGLTEAIDHQIDGIISDTPGKFLEYLF